MMVVLIRIRIRIQIRIRPPILLLTYRMSLLILYIRTTFDMTADDDLCSLYDPVSTTDLTIGTTNTATTPAIDTSSCNPDNALWRGLCCGISYWFTFFSWSIHSYFWFPIFVLVLCLSVADVFEWGGLVQYCCFCQHQHSKSKSIRCHRITRAIASAVPFPTFILTMLLLLLRPTSVDSVSIDRLIQVCVDIW